MRALFGVVVLLVALAAVGMIAMRQLRTVSAPPGLATVDPADAASASAAREPVQNIERRVRDDIGRAMDQAAAARKDAEDKSANDK